MDAFLQDLRYALRSFRRNLGFSAVAILIVAVGVGVTTALFSVVNALLLRPLPISDPARVVAINEHRQGVVSSGSEGMRVSFDRYEAYADGAATAFDGVAAYRFLPMSVRADGPADQVIGAATSGNYFAVLGLQPAIGRLFDQSDEPSVVLSEQYWRTRFGMSADVIGQTIYVNGSLLTVVGVAPAGFRGTSAARPTDLWVPYRAPGSGAAGSIDWGDQWVGMLGRLREGTSTGQAEAVLTTLATTIPAEENVTVSGVGLDPIGLAAQERRAAGTFLGLLTGSAIAVLLIGSSNIAGMLLARAVVRRREVAVRLAVGASGSRLVRQFLTESLVLFVLGGLGGIFLATWATRLMSLIELPELGRAAFDLSLDFRVLAFALGLAGMTGILFGLLPAIQAARPAITDALKETPGGGGSGLGRGRSVFVAAQFAMAVLLLAIGGLVTRTLQNALTLEPGFRIEDVVVATIDLTSLDYDEVTGTALFDELTRRLNAAPGVTSASFANLALLTGSSNGTAFRARPDGDGYGAPFNRVDAHYFETMDIGLVAGRGIAATDVAGGQPVAVVNEYLASRLWPGESPLGKPLVSDDETYEVVGVARDGKYVSYGEESSPFVFLSAAQGYSPDRVLHVRSALPAASVIQLIRTEVAALNPDLAIQRAAPLSEAVGITLFAHRLAAVVVGLFAVVGLVLAGFGVYGVLAHNVAQRLREFGIRTALGARAADIRRLAVGRGAAIAAIGGGIGLGLAAVASLLMRSFFFGVGPIDPVTFVGVPLALVVVALLAGYIPARTAMRVEPIVALRRE